MDGADTYKEYHGLDLSGLIVSGELLVEGATGRFTSAAISLGQAKIGGLARIGSRCTNFEGVFLDCAEFGSVVMVDLEGPSLSEPVKIWSFLIFDGMTCRGNASLSLAANVHLKALKATNCNIGGAFKIVGGNFAPQSQSKDKQTGLSTYSSLDLRRTSAGHEISLSKIYKAASGAANINLQSCAAAELNLTDVSADAILACDAKTRRQIDIKNVTAAQIDVYGSEASDLFLDKVNTGSASEDPAIDLRRISITSLVEIKETTCASLDASYSSCGAIRLVGVTAQSVKANSAVLAEYFRVIGSRIRTVSAAGMKGNPAFEAFDENFNGADLSSELKEYADDEPGKSISEVINPSIESMRRLIGCGAVSDVGHLDVSRGHWSRLDLRHIYFPDPVPCEEGDEAFAVIDARDISVLQSFVLRANQFEQEKGECAVGKPVLSVVDACIKKLDLGVPLPGPIKIRNASIASWGVSQETAEAYFRVLQKAEDRDRWAYLGIEQKLENMGKEEEADKLHILWRRQEAKDWPWRRRIKPYLHDKLLGFGTKSYKVVGWLAFAALIGMLATFSRYTDDLQVSPSVLAVFEECGTRCAMSNAPSLATDSAGAQLIDSAQLALRNAVPIVDTGMANHLEAIHKSPTYWVLFILRILGWIAWPLFLTSAAVGLFPKRHRV